jgi:hypothetical protein
MLVSFLPILQPRFMELTPWEISGILNHLEGIMDSRRPRIYRALSPWEIVILEDLVYWKISTHSLRRSWVTISLKRSWIPKNLWSSESYNRIYVPINRLWPQVSDNFELSNLCSILPETVYWLRHRSETPSAHPTNLYYFTDIEEGQWQANMLPNQKLYQHNLTFDFKH